MLEVKYKLTVTGEYICFMHAVQAAAKGLEITTEVDDYDSEYDMRSTRCKVCPPNTENDEFMCFDCGEVMSSSLIFLHGGCSRCKRKDGFGPLG